MAVTQTGRLCDATVATPEAVALPLPRSELSVSWALSIGPGRPWRSTPFLVPALSTMDDYAVLSDSELAAVLRQYNIPHGPIVGML